MLRPTKYQELIPLIAETCGHSKAVTEAVIKIYFNNLESALSSLAHTRIQVFNLGTFSIKNKAARKRHNRRQTLLQKANKDTERDKSIRSEAAHEIELLEKMFIKIDCQNSQKQSYKRFQKPILENKECHSNMEKQEPNPGRT